MVARACGPSCSMAVVGGSRALEVEVPASSDVPLHSNLDDRVKTFLKKKIFFWWSFVTCSLFLVIFVSFSKEMYLLLNLEAVYFLICVFIHMYVPKSLAKSIHQIIVFSLDNIARPRLYAPVVPATWYSDAGGSLELRRSSCLTVQGCGELCIPAFAVSKKKALLVFILFKIT